MTSERGLGRLNRRVVSCAAALAFVAAGLIGCAAEVEDPPPGEKEAINLGVNAEVGPVSVEDLLVVTRGESEPGRFVGLLLNSSDEAVEVTISDDDDEVTIELAAGQEYGFDANPTVIDSVDGRPGSRTVVTVTVGSEREQVDIPVRDGSLEYLEPYLPEENE